MHRIRVRRFLFARIPPFRRILLVESGSRELFEALLPTLYASHGDQLRVDLVTCFAGTPSAFRESQGQVYRIGDYVGHRPRKRLYQEVDQQSYDVVGIICSGEPIMTMWKWALIASSGGKVFVLNENGDYFWLDRRNWRTALHFVAFRAGLSGTGAASTLARLTFLPFSFLYLALYAAAAHVRRKVQA